MPAMCNSCNICQTWVRGHPSWYNIHRRYYLEFRGFQVTKTQLSIAQVKVEINYSNAPGSSQDEEYSWISGVHGARYCWDSFSSTYSPSSLHIHYLYLSLAFFCSFCFFYLSFSFSRPNSCASRVHVEGSMVALELLILLLQNRERSKLNFPGPKSKPWASQLCLRNRITVLTQ